MKINLSESITSDIPQIPPDQIKPGEIWEVSRKVWSPLILDWQEENSLYQETVQKFLQGKSEPRYVMIVQEPEPSPLAEDVWCLVNVMLLSVKTEYISEVDLIIPSPYQEKVPDLLAETWQVVPMLTCNLCRYTGWRLSRQVYDLLLDVGDFYHHLRTKCPTEKEIQSLGIQVGTASTQQQEIIAFHQQESDWKTVLELPVAAYRTYRKTMAVTEVLLEQALLLEEEISDSNFLVGYSPPQSTSPVVNLSKWWSHTYTPQWLPLEEIIKPQPLNPKFNFRNSSFIGERTQNITNLGDIILTTEDDESLWQAVEELRRLNPEHPALGVRRGKLLDVGGHSLALSVSFISQPQQNAFILLQLYPTGDNLYLPPHLKLSLLDESGLTLLDTEATKSLSTCEQIQLSGFPGEKFTVKIVLEGAVLKENFVI